MALHRGDDRLFHRHGAISNSSWAPGAHAPWSGCCASRPSPGVRLRPISSRRKSCGPRRAAGRRWSPGRHRPGQTRRARPCISSGLIALSFSGRFKRDDADLFVGLVQHDLFGHRFLPVRLPSDCVACRSAQRARRSIAPAPRGYRRPRQSRPRAHPTCAAVHTAGPRCAAGNAVFALRRPRGRTARDSLAPPRAVERLVVVALSRQNTTMSWSGLRPAPQRMRQVGREGAVAPGVERVAVAGNGADPADRYRPEPARQRRQVETGSLGECRGSARPDRPTR